MKSWGVLTSLFNWALPLLREQRIGWCFWELMLGKTQFSRKHASLPGAGVPGWQLLRSGGGRAGHGRARETRPDSCFPSGLDPWSSGAWEDDVKFSDGWTRWTGSGPRKDRLHYARHAGATATWETQGGAAVLIHRSARIVAALLVLVDGVPAAARVSTPTRRASSGTIRTELARDLPAGRHVVTIVTLGREERPRGGQLPTDCGLRERVNRSTDSFLEAVWNYPETRLRPLRRAH